jgi:stage III sporulation protein AG
MNREEWKKRWEGWLQKAKQMRFALLVIGVGVLLLLFPSGKAEEEEVAVESPAAQTTYDVSQLEEKLSQVLGEIKGVGEVQVVLTLRSGTRQVYATERSESTDTDGSGESQETVARISAGSNQQEALEVMEIYPTFQGALVVCDGGEDPSVQLAVTKSVAALTGLSTDKISVCGRASNP